MHRCPDVGSSRRPHELSRYLPLLHRAPAHPDRPLGSPCSLLFCRRGHSLSLHPIGPGAVRQNSQSATPELALSQSRAHRQLRHQYSEQPHPLLPAAPHLPPQRQDLLKPLLQIAKVLGGEWPRRVTTALTEVFKNHLNRERQHLLDLLFELREAFSHYGQPERISTASLLAWLHHHPDASWNQEGPISANRLADMLRPFDIYPRLKHKKGQPSHRGYTLQDFLYTWNVLLPPESTMNRNTSRRQPMPDPPPSSRTNEATVRAALETAASNSDAATPIFPNNDAGGNNRTT